MVAKRARGGLLSRESRRTRHGHQDMAWSSPDSAHAVGPLLRRSASLAHSVTACANVAILARSSDPDGFRVLFECPAGRRSRSRPEFLTPAEAAVADWVTESRRPLILPDSTNDRPFGVDQSFANREIGACIALPIEVNRVVWGVLIAWDKNPRSFEESEEIALGEIADLLAAALTQNTAVATQRRQAETHSTLTEIVRVAGISVDLNEISTDIAQDAKRLVPFDRMEIAVFDQLHLETRLLSFVGKAIVGRTPEFTTPIAETPDRRLLEQGSGFVCAHDSLRRLAIRCPGVAQALSVGMHALLVVPLSLHGEVVGSLHFYSASTHSYGVPEILLAEQIARAVSGPVVRSERARALRNRADQAFNLSQVGLIASSGLQLDEVLNRSVHHLAQLVPHDGLALEMVNPVSQMPEETYVGVGDRIERFNADSRAFVEVSDAALATRQTVLRNLATDPAGGAAFLPSSFRSGEPPRLLLATPLIQAARAVGIFTFWRDGEAPAFTPQDAAVAERIALFLGGAVAKHRLHRELNDAVAQRDRVERFAVAATAADDEEALFDAFKRAAGNEIRFDSADLSPPRAWRSADARERRERQDELCPSCGPLQSDRLSNLTGSGGARGAIHAVDHQCVATLMPASRSGLTCVRVDLRVRDRDLGVVWFHRVRRPESMVLGNLGRLAAVFAAALDHLLLRRRTRRAAQVGGPYTSHAFVASFAEELDLAHFCERAQQALRRIGPVSCSVLWRGKRAGGPYSAIYRSCRCTETGAHAEPPSALFSAERPVGSNASSDFDPHVARQAKLLSGAADRRNTTPTEIAYEIDAGDGDVAVLLVTFHSATSERTDEINEAVRLWAELTAEVLRRERAKPSTAISRADKAITAPGQLPRLATAVNLTERDLTLLKMVAQGMSNVDIAEAFHLSRGTVRNRLGDIYRRLGATGRASAVAAAICAGLLQ